MSNLKSPTWVGSQPLPVTPPKRPMNAAMPRLISVVYEWIQFGPFRLMRFTWWLIRLPSPKYEGEDRDDDEHLVPQDTVEVLRPGVRDEAVGEAEDPEEDHQPQG